MGHGVAITIAVGVRSVVAVAVTVTVGGVLGVAVLRGADVLLILHDLLGLDGSAHTLLIVDIGGLLVVDGLLTTTTGSSLVEALVYL